MTADPDAIAIAHADVNDFVDRGFGAGDQLIYVMIVRGFAGANDRHRRVIEHRITRQQ